MATATTRRPAVLGLPITHWTLASAVDGVLDRAAARRGGWVCLANVFTVMEALDRPAFRAVVDSADLVVPDGMPLAWSLRADGFQDAERVAGMELAEALLTAAERARLPVGFHGGRPEVLDLLRKKVAERWPGLTVAYTYSPPFRVPTPEEERSRAEAINDSGARILFVGLGCPKQEVWMAANRTRIDATMVGVGAVFDFMAGAKRRAPLPLQRSGLEWAFRLAQEPRRLFRRYAYHNPRFIWRMALRRLGRSE